MRHVFGGFPALMLIPSRDMSTATWPFWAALVTGEAAFPEVDVGA